MRGVVLRRGALPRDANGLLVRQGRDLITATYAYMGPNVPDVANRYAGNNLACTNCHDGNFDKRKSVGQPKEQTGQYDNDSPSNASSSADQNPNNMDNDRKPIVPEWGGPDGGHFDMPTKKP